MANSKNISKPEEPTTDDLLQALNDAAADATDFTSQPEEVPGSVQLPAGTLKVILYRPAARQENVERNRNTGGRAKRVPELLVIERGEDGKAAFHHAFNFAGAVEPRVSYLGSHRPYKDWLPDRIPGNSGTDSSNFIATDDLEYHLVTEGELTLLTRAENRAAVPVPNMPKRKPFLPGVEALPEFVRASYTTPGLSDALAVFEDFIVEQHAANRQVGAARLARALNDVIPALAIIDSKPVPPAPPKGDLRYQIDGSSPVLLLANDLSMNNRLYDAFVAVVRVVTTHAHGTMRTGEGPREICERAASCLIIFRDLVRQF